MARRAHRLELWKALGIASFVEYAGRYLGVKRRPAKERLRVALALALESLFEDRGGPT